MNVFICRILRLLSEVDLPFRTFFIPIYFFISRGTFIEYRSCMLNICPIGRSATKEQRDQFEILDKEKQIRKSIIDQLQAEFPDLKLTYLIGGQSSFDILPEV